MEPLQLVLLKQTSLVEDSMCRNGNQRVLHVVVKNSPFNLVFGVSPQEATQIDLNKYNTDVKLLYDTEPEKEVDFVKEKPIQYKITVNQNTKISLELRIKVLTSQLEDSLFKIFVRVVDPTTKIPIFTSYSESIKVISKSDQVKRKKPGTSKKKKTSNDNVGEALLALEGQQDYQGELLAQLRQLQSQPPVTVAPVAPTGSAAVSAALQRWLTAFDRLSPAARRTAARRLQRFSGAAELTDLLRAEGLGHSLDSFRPADNPDLRHSMGPPLGPPTTFATLSTPHSSSSLPCDCPSCPHREELQRIEGFYDDVFSLRN